MIERMSAAARELQDQHDPASTMKTRWSCWSRTSRAARRPASRWCAARASETATATDEMAVVGDRLQSELGEGPSLDAVWEEETVYVSDIATDSRWPTWGRRMAAETGARSMLCLRLFTVQDTLGALTMYSTHVVGFTEADMVEGAALAAHIAIALAASQQIDQLGTALDSRTVIAQACGIVMERYKIDAVRAFALLTRLSSTQNVKLRDVAAQVVLDRVLSGEIDGDEG